MLALHGALLALCLKDAGRPAEGRDQMLLAIDVAEDAVLTAAVRHGNLSAIHADLTEFDAAAAASDRAVETLVEHYPAGTAALAVLMANRATMEGKRQAWAAAAGWWLAAAAVTEAVAGPAAPPLLGRLGSAGVSLQRAGQLAAARSVLERAVAVGERVHGVDHPALATAYANYGLLLRRTADRGQAPDWLARACGSAWPPTRQRPRSPSPPPTPTSAWSCTSRTSLTRRPRTCRPPVPCFTVHAPPGHPQRLRVESLLAVAAVSAAVDPAG